MNSSSRRRTYRKILKSTKSRFSYLLNHDWVHYTDTSDQDWIDAQVEKDNRRFLTLSRICVDTPTKKAYREPDYTGVRIVKQGRDDTCDFREQCEEFNPVHMNIPRRTMKDLL